MTWPKNGKINPTKIRPKFPKGARVDCLPFGNNSHVIQYFKSFPQGKSTVLIMTAHLANVWHLHCPDELVRHLHHLVHRVLLSLLNPLQLGRSNVLTHWGGEFQKSISLEETYRFANGGVSCRSSVQKQHWKTLPGRRAR